MISFPRKLRYYVWTVAALFFAGVLAFAFGYREFAANFLSPVERGRKTADRAGCFSCHGPAGISGIRNPTVGETELMHAPPWSQNFLTRYRNTEEIREWIMDGAPARLRNDPEWMKTYANERIHMPAYRGVLSSRELSDLVVYVKAISWIEQPLSEEALYGRTVAGKYDCFQCHGPTARGLVRNPKSLMGYIPAWTGDDYKELVKNDQEFRDWVMHGSIPRLEKNPVAKFFLKRQVIAMPAYEGFVDEKELKALKAYIEWLRVQE